MAKTPKLKTNLSGKQVRLLHSLCDCSGEPHPYAGQEVTIIDRSSKTSYTAATADEFVIVVREEDWGPTEAEMQAMLAKPAGPVSAEFAEQLQTINLYTDPTINVAELIDLDLIDDSPSQPRTNYPDDYIAGLAESMKVVGMISPMLLRRKADGRYENVFGHCRKRGARLAGLKQGPAFVRDLTDAESAQLQAVENLQRKDLDAFDEAQSFAAYIKAHGCTKDEFCRRTGLSRTQVYNRLKLATLHDAGIKALREGKIKQEVATRLARVPGEKQQAHGLKLILENTHGSGEPDELMTVRKASSILREKFTLALKDALWARDDATLVPSAGACTVCPKRSGVDPVVYVDLLGDKGSYGPPRGENVCTDPACFDDKKTAQLKANQAVLEANGKTVITGNKARQAISATGEVKNGYIPLKDVRDAIKKATTKGKPTPAIATLTLQDPRTGKTVEVVKLDEVKAAGLKVAEPKASSGGYGSAGWKESEAKREAQREKARAEASAATDFNMALLEKVRKAAIKVPRGTLALQLIAQLAISGVQHSDEGVIETLYGVDRIHHLRDQIGSWPDEELGQFILDCALAHNVVASEYGRPAVATPLLSAAKHYGVDVEALRKELKATAAKTAAKGKKSAPVGLEAA